jgi:hypothetical protein
MKKQSEDYLLNAENCAQLALDASDEPTRKRFQRMEAAWRELAKEQDWLDGEVPVKTNGKVRKTPPRISGANRKPDAV